MIDTTNVPGRRVPRFESLDAMLADARACAAAERGGKLTRLGNWTLGQSLNHIAAWIEYPYVGYPPELVIPEEMKANAKSIKQQLMRAAMRPGERLPISGAAAGAGTLATEIVPTATGLARLESAAGLLRSGEPSHPDPAFGRITAHEWTQMTLRHAELHLSFLVPA